MNHTLFVVYITKARGDHSGVGVTHCCEYDWDALARVMLGEGLEAHDFPTVVPDPDTHDIGWGLDEQGYTPVRREHHGSWEVEARD